MLLQTIMKYLESMLVNKRNAMLTMLQILYIKGSWIDSSQLSDKDFQIVEHVSS